MSSDCHIAEVLISKLDEAILDSPEKLGETCVTHIVLNQNNTEI